MTTTTLSDFCLWKRNRIIWEPILTIDQKSNFDFQYKLIFGWLAIDGKLEAHRVQIWIRICIVFCCYSELNSIWLLGHQFQFDEQMFFLRLLSLLFFPILSTFFTVCQRVLGVFNCAWNSISFRDRERSRAALELLLCKTHRAHQIFSLLLQQIFYKIMALEAKEKEFCCL